MSLASSPSPAELAERTFAFAREAEARRDWAQALSRWTLARNSFPDHSTGYIGGAVALRELGRFDEAETLLRDAMARFPNDPGPAIGWAALSHGRQDWAAAAERWARLRAEFPQQAVGYALGAAALRALARHTEAEAVLDAGVEHCPGDATLAIEHARIAHAARDWPEAARRWARVRACAADQPGGYAAGAQALHESGRRDEADTLLTQAVRRFSDQPELAIEWARLGAQQSDAGEAVRRWELVRQRHPDQLAGHLGLVQALRRALRFDDAETVVAAALERFPDEAQLRFEQAVVAAERADWPAAAERWQLLRTRFPDQPWGFIGGAIAAREQGQKEAAEALFQQAIALFPDDLAARLEYARTAHLDGDWDEATERWAALRQHHPPDPVGYVAGAAALSEAGRIDEAEALIAETVNRFPEQQEAAVQHGWIANRRRDWAEAVRRWEAVRQRYPAEIAGYWGAAQALRCMRRFAEAEAMIAEAGQRLPESAEPLVEYSWIAHDQHHWPEAIRRWETVRQRMPDHVEAYASGGEALARAGRFVEAETLVAEAFRRFPENPLPYAAAANIVAVRSEWAEAVVRWGEAQRRFPDKPEFSHRLFEARLWLAESEAVTATSLQPAPADSDDLYELMMAFESLGSGCEFGDVQRRFGAEPLGLLRWAAVSPGDLAAAIRTGFDGIGSPEAKELTIRDTGEREVYWLHDRRLGIEMHTFVTADLVSPEQMLAESCRRLERLGRKLLDDLRSGEKIFVYKLEERNITDEEGAELHRALRGHGNAALLCVRRSDDAHPPGLLETPSPGLMIGYLERFAEPQPNGRLDVPAEAWAGLCRDARDLMSARPASGVFEPEVINAGTPGDP